jgi:adenosylcobinamide kinase/adenosylcobinamide-phosphate guanylyltransferase
MAKLILILGGARSGKSTFAQRKALQRALDQNDRILFVATATAEDAEMQERIERHRRDRPSGWDTLEVTHDVASAIGGLKNTYAVIILDCLTLLISHHLVELDEQDDRRAAAELVGGEVQALIDLARAGGADLVVVSNEVGLGIVPATPLAREFRDLAGLAHQRLAEAADEVYFMVAGIPQALKIEGGPT